MYDSMLSTEVEEALTHSILTTRFTWIHIYV